MSSIKARLQNRFVSYVKTWTTSDQNNADNGIIPSTDNEAKFAKTIESELNSLGIKDVTVTEHSYVCARIPATTGFENVPSIGFLAHMDTAPDVSGKDVNPQVIDKYDGSLINLKDGIFHDPKTDEALFSAIGETIITTDGTTLLGADDKAGIATIMTAIEEILQNPALQHGQIEIIFSPDEETGHGMDFVPIEWIQSKQCYTMDGGHLGELECECFTAYKTEITFNGISKHTGYARPSMVNAVTMACAFVNLLPQNESPEATDGYYGFYAPMNISGHIEEAKVILYLRDFTMEKMQKRLDTVMALAKAMEFKFPGGTVEVVHTKQYLNMKEELDKAPNVMNKLIQAVKNIGIEPVFKPIRGGTDGSRLTEMGIPTPNVFTGAHNIHARKEWVSVNQMEYAVKTIIELAKLWTE